MGRISTHSILISLSLLISPAFAGESDEPEAPTPASIGSPKSTEALLQTAAQSTEPEGAIQAWTELAQRDEPNVLPLLFKAFDEAKSLDDPAALNAAIEAVQHAAQQTGGSEKILEHISKRPSETASTAKRRMIEMLKRIDTHASRSLLIPFLSEADAEVKCAAINAVEFSESPEVLLLLTNALDSKDVRVCKDTALALGRCKCIAALPKLIELLASKDAGVKTNAAWACKAITAQQFSSSTEAGAWLKKETLESDENFARLKEQFQNGNPELTPLAIEELCDFSLLRDNLIEELSKHVNDSVVRIKASVCEALGHTVRSSNVLTILVAKLRDPSKVVAATAWRALKHLTGKEFPNGYAAWNEWLRVHG
ncbi:MAG TPA: HEAT repeat domain-containing protein [Planctomycetota bacterium]|nr:HEAT repeat domain-containing protein [Planctomycetota bacterium]